MTYCIGRLGGFKGDWYAEIDFDAAEATVIERGEKGVAIGPIATVPLGAILDETEERDHALDPEDDRNKNLCKIVFAPEAWEALQEIKRVLEREFPVSEAAPSWVDDIDRDIDRALECLEVPE